MSRRNKYKHNRKDREPEQLETNQVSNDGGIDLMSILNMIKDSLDFAPADLTQESGVSNNPIEERTPGTDDDITGSNDKVPEYPEPNDYITESYAAVPNPYDNVQEPDNNTKDAIGTSEDEVDALQEEMEKNPEIIPAAENTEIEQQEEALQYASVYRGSKASVYGIINSHEEDVEDESAAESLEAVETEAFSTSNLQCYIEAMAELPEYALQARSTDTDILINKCDLNSNLNRLYVEGTIKEEVEYCTAASTSPESVSGDIRRITIKIPFEVSSNICIKDGVSIPKQYTNLQLKPLSIEGNKRNSRGNTYYSIGFAEVIGDTSQEEVIPLDTRMNNISIFKNIRKKLILNMEVSLLKTSPQLSDEGTVEL
jgi:hypothetical protein